MKTPLALASALAIMVPVPQIERPKLPAFACGSVFRPDITVANLEERFGAPMVQDREISIGEGDYVRGTAVFPGTADQLEILWQGADRRSPSRIIVNQSGSRWATPEGIKVGTALRDIERMNRRPFRLLGFGWDYTGTVMSWSGGHLERGDTESCRLRVRLRPTAADLEHNLSYRQVIGDREFSSGHPAMQDLNPRIYEMWLDFE
jgi:hypothetical protein